METPSSFQEWRLRKGHIHKQSSLTCPSIRCSGGFPSPCACLYDDLPGRTRAPSVSSAFMQGLVGRCLVLCKLKGIMAFPAEHRYMSEITGGPGTLPAPKNIPPAPTGSSGRSRGLRRSQHSEGWHPHCRCSTRGARLPLPRAGQPGPGPLRTREGWGTSGT